MFETEVNFVTKLRSLNKNVYLELTVVVSWSFLKCSISEEIDWLTIKMIASDRLIPGEYNCLDCIKVFMKQVSVFLTTQVTDTLQCDWLTQ